MTNQNNYYATIVCLIYLILVLIMISGEDHLLVKQLKRVKVIAHRGNSSLAPENTIAAFDQAIACHVDYIELDIQMSKDNKIIVMHDMTVNRTTNGHGLVRDFTLKELKKLDVGYWFHPAYVGEKIPTLQEVLKKYTGKTGFLVEVKYPNLYPGIEKSLVKVLKKHKNIQEKIIVQSFEAGVIKRLKQYLPNISTCLLLNGLEAMTEASINDYSKFANYVNLPIYMLDKPTVQMIQATGVEVIAWDVHSKKEFQEATRMGIEAVVTDNPSLKKERKVIQNQHDGTADLIGFVLELFNQLKNWLHSLV